MGAVVSPQPPCFLRLNCSNSVSAAVPIPINPRRALRHSRQWKAFRRRVAGAWANAARRIGTERVPENSRLLLKHTFGLKLRVADVSFEDHQDVLGHRSARSTMHYSQSGRANFRRRREIQRCCSLPRSNRFSTFAPVRRRTPLRPGPVQARAAGYHRLFNHRISNSWGIRPVPCPVLGSRPVHRPSPSQPDDAVPTLRTVRTPALRTSRDSITRLQYPLPTLQVVRYRNRMVNARSSWRPSLLGCRISPRMMNLLCRSLRTDASSGQVGPSTSARTKRSA
jgi:hypothetical protein